MRKLGLTVRLVDGFGEEQKCSSADCKDYAVASDELASIDYAESIIEAYYRYKKQQG